MLLGAALAAACSGNNKPAPGETASARTEASSVASNVDTRIQDDVPPERVAVVLGVFEGGSREPADALVTQAQIDAMGEEQKKVIFLPRETTVDGKPAVEYWATSGEVPLWKSTAVIHPDRTVQLSRREFWD